MQRSYSFEFFPPKTPEGTQKLAATRAELIALGPDFISVTFGAGGTTREGTLAAVLDVIADGVPAAPHLSCVGSTRAGIRDILNEYKGAGIRRIVALRGDRAGLSINNPMMAFVVKNPDQVREGTPAADLIPELTNLEMPS